MKNLVSILVVTVTAAIGAARPAEATPAKCLAASGKRGSVCLAAYAKAVDKCRKKQDAACEAALREDGGTLAALLDDTDEPVANACNDADAETLGYLSVDDVQLRIDDGCVDWGEDALALEYADEPSSLDGALLGCQKIVASTLAKLRAKTIALFGRSCFLSEAKGRTCNRERRDSRFERAQQQATSTIGKRCKDRFAGLGIGTLDEVVATTATHARHFAILVYPPNDLGPSSERGPYPIGVTTLELADPSRTNVPGDGPRPVVTEVYYPSTEEAVSGKPREVVSVLGVPITQIPAYRDVARAEGRFPLVVFSHGNNGIRIQSLYFYAHLASHGYVVATPDHHGNTFVDSVAQVFDASSVVNRPLDMSFLIDQMLLLDGQPSGRFAGAIDADRIGAAGHSFGGYTSFALATESVVGTPVDGRVKAIMPQAPAVVGPDDIPLFTDEALGALAIPTLIVGGSLDQTTPFEANQRHPFELLPAGAAVVGLARLNGAGHFTFSNYCDVDRALLGFLNGFDEACLPRHLPWRQAHDITNFLALNFFDAVLRGDADALGRLHDAAHNGLDDLDLTLK